jgi:Glycosyltransferase WbsX
MDGHATCTRFTGGIPLQGAGARPMTMRRGVGTFASMGLWACLVTGCGGESTPPPPTLPPPPPPATPAATFPPCEVADPARASGQTRARLGAYYFDGWSGPLTHSHFNGLVAGPYQGRQPLSGWQDNDPCVIEQQLVWAREIGFDFFVYLWYFRARVFSPDENLNSALQITHALRDRHGMQYAILYVNHPPFAVGPGDWSSTVAEWTPYLADPDYLRIDGRPAFFVYDIVGMRNSFGSASAVANAFSTLRTAARARGLPGVYVVGCFGVWNGSVGEDDRFPDLSWVPGDGYDAMSTYGYAFAPAAASGERPFSILAEAGRWIWRQAQAKSPLPFIPVAMAGWDPRPWREAEAASGVTWYRRRPQEVAQFVEDAITGAESNPRVRPEAASPAPLVLIEAWNELGEGSYLVPTVGDGKAYGAALASALARDP